MQFAKEFPALLNKNGFPANYRVFRSGVVTLGRMNALDQLKMSRSVRAGQTDTSSFEKWIEEKIGQSGIPIVPPEDL